MSCADRLHGLKTRATEAPPVARVCNPCEGLGQAVPSLAANTRSADEDIVEVLAKSVLVEVGGAVAADAGVAPVGLISEGVFDGTVLAFLRRGLGGCGFFGGAARCEENGEGGEAASG